MNTTSPQVTEPLPVAAPRNAVLNNQEQATIGKSLVIKGEVSGSEALYIDGGSQLAATARSKPTSMPRKW
jgi:cytoskeletal protein CcmA (bactofilin family)